MLYHIGVSLRLPFRVGQGTSLLAQISNGFEAMRSKRRSSQLQGQLPLGCWRQFCPSPSLLRGLHFGI